MATDFSFKFTNGIEDAKVLDRKLNRAAFAVVKYWDGRAESHMKQKAPWKDRTTNARNGLSAKAVKLGAGVYAIILSHAVTYGIFLERGTRKMKARPIIIPTLAEYGPKVMRTFNKILNRL